jgi:hypothetical protein
MGLMHTGITKFRFSNQNKKSEGELIFIEKTHLRREKPTIVAFLKYRLSSAVLDFEGAIWVTFGTSMTVMWCFDFFVRRLRKRQRCPPAAFAVSYVCL